MTKKSHEKKQEQNIQQQKQFLNFSFSNKLTPNSVKCNFGIPIVATKDLLNIHQNYFTGAQDYTQHSVRLNYFYQRVRIFGLNIDRKIDHDIAHMLRPQGLIEIDNSPLNHQFENFKIIRLYAVLHDAGAFV